MIYCWIIPVIVGLLCALLGYLLGKMCFQGKTKECNRNYKKLKKEYDDCKKQHKELKQSLDSLGKEKQHFSSQPQQVKQTIVPLVFDADAAKTAFGKKIKADDLTVVEGIGPKIKELFHKFDVKTWEALSETSVERCQEILNSAGERYKIHNPGTWPRQAKLAFEGKWKELVNWQDELDGGVE